MNDTQNLIAPPPAISATTPPPPDLIMGVANVLEGARTIALRKWDKERCDLYHVAERAWRAQAMVVPLAAVTAQLRRVVPDGRLLAFQDQEGRTRAEVADKFTEARDALLAGNTPTSTEAEVENLDPNGALASSALPVFIGATDTGPAVTDISLGHLLGVDLSDDEWQRKSLCAQTDPEAFFPEKGGSTRDAKRICQRCPVIGNCLNYALAHDERFGIWGGLSERERRRLKRELLAAAGGAEDVLISDDHEDDDLDDDELDDVDDDFVADLGDDDDADHDFDDFNDIRKAG